MISAKRIQLAKGVIEYSLEGAGAPVLMLHGGHSSCRERFGVESLLKAGYCVLTPSRPGLWRQEHILSRPKDHLLSDILVALSGKPSEWQALEQALLIAKREEARILGLHIAHTVEDRLAITRLEDEFQARCENRGVVGELAIEYSTQTAALICDRARWSDLVVTKLAYPPAAQPLAKIRSGFRRLVRRSPRPLLAVPAGSSPLEHPLLAYDGSPKAKEALFLAAYLAGKWQKALSVITIETAHTNEQQLEEARAYLEKHHIEASYLYKKKPCRGRDFTCRREQPL